MMGNSASHKVQSKSETENVFNLRNISYYMECIMSKNIKRAPIGEDKEI